MTSLQDLTNARFHEQAERWDDLYRQIDVFGVIHQHRQALALAVIERLPLPAAPRTLEVGGGAGRFAIALAKLGHRVSANDAVDAMVDLARRNAAIAGVQEHFDFTVADAHRLDFGDQEFHLAVALGVVPWVEDPARVVSELTRVLKPGGYLVATVDNRRRLSFLLDPVRTPVLRPAVEVMRSVGRRFGLLSGPSHWARQYWPLEFERLLLSAGLETVYNATYGFGPFTFLRFNVVPNRLGLVVNRRLQRLADRGSPGLRWLGEQYMVVARKPLPVKP